MISLAVSSTCLESVKSTICPEQLFPYFFRASAESFTVGFMSVSATVAPHSENASAQANPMFLAPPLITTVFPSRLYFYTYI